MEIINTLLEITIYSGVIFIAVMLLKTALKNSMSPLLHYAVWALLVVRLLIPVTLTSPIHLIVIPETQNDTIEQYVQTQTEETASAPQEANTAYTPETQYTAGSSQSNQTHVVPSSSSNDRMSSVLSLPDVMLAAWLSGAGVCLLYLTVLYITLRRKIRKNAAPPSKRLLELYKGVKAELGINTDLKLVCMYEYGTPALMFPRTIVMPVDALVAMDDEQAKLALRHELMHFKRRDHVVSIILSLLNAVYWFNPFVWLAFREMRADMETACDGSVVRTMDGDGRNRYASLIVNLFSQPRHRQLVLGMARGDAKSIAERRIRGVFMDGRSKNGVKLISGLLAALLAFTCFTTACQPTPESEIVRQKNANAPALANAVLYNKADFPETYKDSYSRNGADIIFDAAVEAPDADALPTYDISPAPFTQAQVDTIIKALFGDTQMYEPAQVTKSQLEPEYLKALSDLNDKKADPDHYENTLEYYQSEVDRLKEELENAAETDILTPVDSKLKASPQPGTEYYGGRGDLGKDKMAHLIILNNTDSPYQGDNSFLMFVNGDEYVDMLHYYPFMRDDGPTSLKTTKDEAIAQADDIVSRLGAGYMEYAGCATGVKLSENGQLPEKFVPQLPQAYIIHYTRTQNNVSATYDLRNGTNTVTVPTAEDNADEAYTAPQAYERINVTVDDTGVTYIGWQGLMTVTRTSVENNRIIPFDDIITLAKNQFSFYFAAYGQQPSASGYAMAQPSSPVALGDAVGNNVHIQKITLGFMQLPVKDEDRWQLVPVWDFFGDYESEYSNGAKETQYKDKESMLTINAVDGSVIDRNIGY